MNDALKMQISAFVDGELPENESELLLRRLSQDHALRQQVARYLAIGRLIRGDHQPAGMSELRERIAAALGEEPVPQTAESSVSKRSFTRPAIGIAIAASVAVLGLFVAARVFTPTDPQNDGASFAGRTVPDSRSVTTQPDDELLRQYYLHHNPRLVTWELRDGSLSEVETDEEAAADAEPRADDDSR